MIKVWHLKDNIYQVVSLPDDEDYSEKEILFQGTLADCEAYIRLREGDYLQ